MKKGIYFLVIAIFLIAQVVISKEVRNSSERTISSNRSKTTKLQKVRSDIPLTISHQGVIMDDDTALNGEYDLSFAIYTAPTGGTSVWSESHSSITIDEGIFNVILGSTTPIALDFTVQYYLGVTLDSGTEFSPRVQLTTSPYAFNSKKADTADVATDIDTDVAVTSLNGKQNSVNITAGDNILIDDTGADIVVSADLSAISDTDELVKVGATGDPGYLSEDDFSSSTKKNSKGIITIKDDAITESKLDVNNTPSDEFALTYDNATSKMQWTNVATLVSGDNMGDHIATENIALNGHWLSDNGNSHGISIDDLGNVGIGTSDPSYKLEIGDGGGIKIDSSTTLGMYIDRSDQGGIFINSAEWYGVYVENSTYNGFLTGNTGSDAFLAYNVGSPSGIAGSSLSNGVEIQGTAGHGVFIGQSDNTGVLVHRVGNPSNAYTSSYKNAFEVRGVEGNGLRIGYAGYHGIWIDETSSNGIFINQAGYNGIAINTAGSPSNSYSTSISSGFKIHGTSGYGVYIGRSDNDAIRISSAGDDGLQIDNVYDDGITVDNPGDMGIYVYNAGNDAGIFVADDMGVASYTNDTNHEYGLWTNDKTYSAYGYDGSKMNSFGKNTGDQSLEPGDLVSISGGYEEDTFGRESGIPIIHIKKADKNGSNSIFGVVEYRVSIKEEIEELENGKGINQNCFKRADSDIANTGDYLSIVILGPTDVKVADRSESILAGEPLKVSSNAGVRKIKTTIINGLEISENIGIVGKALENSNGKGMVKVFVNCK